MNTIKTFIDAIKTFIKCVRKTDNFPIGLFAVSTGLTLLGWSVFGIVKLFSLLMFFPIVIGIIGGMVAVGAGWVEIKDGWGLDYFRI